MFGGVGSERYRDKFNLQYASSWYDGSTTLNTGAMATGPARAGKKGIVFVYTVGYNRTHYHTDILLNGSAPAQTLLQQLSTAANTVYDFGFGVYVADLSAATSVTVTGNVGANIPSVEIFTVENITGSLSAEVFEGSWPTYTLSPTDLDIRIGMGYYTSVIANTDGSGITFTNDVKFHGNYDWFCTGAMQEAGFGIGQLAVPPGVTSTYTTLGGNQCHMRIRGQ